MLSIYFFFFKQKTAYEMRISDWSSDVCSSDLCRSPGLRHTRDVEVTRRIIDIRGIVGRHVAKRGGRILREVELSTGVDEDLGIRQIGRASCRERVCQYV